MKLLSAYTSAPALNTVVQSDALALLKALPDASVALIATDPPYNGVKADDWDNQWQDDREFLGWLRLHLVEMRRVLKPNGSLYVFASPRLAARVEVLTSEYFNVLNQVVWNKASGNANWRADKEIIRSYLPNTERIIFAEQYGGDTWASGESRYWLALDDLRGFLYEPLRAYLDGERRRAGLSPKEVTNILGNQMYGHYFTTTQWSLPTAEQYKKLQVGFNATGGDYLRREYEDLRREYEDLRREYEDLRREYEDLRRPFNSTPYAPYTDVWTFRTVQAYPGKHPTEKPLDLMRHIVSMSSRPGDLVVDPFAGSGTTLVAARNLGRQFIGGDISAEYVALARRRLELPYTINMFEAMAVGAD